jgi:hypothetical protein
MESTVELHAAIIGTTVAQHGLTRGQWSSMWRRSSARSGAA